MIPTLLQPKSSLGRASCLPRRRDHDGGEPGKSAPDTARAARPTGATGSKHVHRRTDENEKTPEMRRARSNPSLDPSRPGPKGRSPTEAKRRNRRCHRRAGPFDFIVSPPGACRQATCDSASACHTRADRAAADGNNRQVAPARCHVHGPEVGIDRERAESVRKNPVSSD